MEGNIKENIGKNSKKIIAIFVLCAVVLAAILLLYFGSGDKSGEPENSSKPNEETDALVPPSANPLDFVTPEATPLEKTNPFKYENPFE